MIRIGFSDPQVHHVRTGTNAVFRSGDVLIRVAHPGYDLVSLYEQSDLIDFLVDRGFPTPGRLSPVMEVDGRLVTCWGWVEGSAEPSDRLFGALMRRFHQVAADYPGRAPGWTPQLRAQARLGDSVVDVPQCDREVLEQHLTNLLEGVGEADLGPEGLIHGDAHSGNVLAGQEQYWLLDFERFSRGPIEWDLTQRAAKAKFFDGDDAGWYEFLAGYGDITLSAHHDRLVDLRALIMTTWLLTLEPTPAVLAERTVRLEYWHAWSQRGAPPSTFARWSPL